ncbi:MAG: DUF4214 domain-containing protein, partial [Candidatus Saccharimonadales bacterium]
MRAQQGGRRRAFTQTFHTGTRFRVEPLESRRLPAAAPMASAPRGDIPAAEADGSTASSAFDDFVNAIYQVLLSRTADSAALAYWTPLLEQGLSRIDFANSVVHSQEYLADLVRAAYRQNLGRAPDDAGMRFWLADFTAGNSDQSFDTSILSSDEFYARVGADDRDWIDALYQDLFGRSSDPRGEAYWIEQLATGAARSQIAQRFFGSQEGERNQVEDAYSRLLGQSGDAQGVQYWT